MEKLGFFGKKILLHLFQVFLRLQCANKMVHKKHQGRTFYTAFFVTLFWLSE